MGALTPANLIFILVIALLVIGPGKLPETGAALGRAMREFRHAMDGTDEASTLRADAAAADEASPAPVGPSQADGTSSESDGGGGGSGGLLD